MGVRAGRIACCVGLLALVAGCSGSSGCPSGTVAQGGTCVPVEDLPSVDQIILPDTTVIDPGSDPGSDVPPVDEGQDGVEVADPGADVPDGTGPETFPGGVIGKSCQGDKNCQTTGVEDGSCLGWPKGYCTVTACDAAATCPEGAGCVLVGSATAACLATCLSDADCRAADGYACKDLADVTGAPVRACYKANAPGAGVGEACTAPEDCAGAATCLRSFADGYCATLFCGDLAPCPEGSACARITGLTACLKSCATEADCKLPGDPLRACTKLPAAVGAGKVQVCGSGTQGLPVGSSCTNETDCATFDCETVYTGVCSQSKRGCRTDEDCPGVDHCLQSPEATVGYCTKDCASPYDCPSQSLCVVYDTEASGQCLPGCIGTGDKTCKPELGLSCVFGDPVGITTGHYACTRLRTRVVGARCKADAECDPGLSCLIGKDWGYCTRTCGMVSPCPFPTSCQQAGGLARCLLRCTSDSDCPLNMTCTTPEGATSTVCWPA